MGDLNRNHVPEIRRTLTDPLKVCTALGLLRGASKQARGGLFVCCPAHGDRTPSCSVTVAPDGFLRVHCFSCKWGGDVLSLVAQVHGLDPRREFKEILIDAAQIAGLTDIIDELNDRKEYKPRPLPPMPEAGPEPEYPPADEVSAVWDDAEPVSSDPAATDHLRARSIDPNAATQLALGRVLVNGTTHTPTLPRWARLKGSTWLQTGHRLLVRMYDHTGTVRSLRAWRVEGDCPAKRLPPAGHKATGLVLANSRARELLERKLGPRKIVVCEGEPDWMTWSVHRPDLPVFGIVVGSWNPEFTKRIPYGSEVIIRTHHDPAGNRYAADILETVKTRAAVYRSEVKHVA